MSDRRSPGIFSAILLMLSENPTDDHKAMARRIWKLSQDYDFSAADFDEETQAAGIALGIARRGVDPRQPDTGEWTLWLFEDYQDD